MCKSALYGTGNVEGMTGIVVSRATENFENRATELKGAYAATNGHLLVQLVIENQNSHRKKEASLTISIKNLLSGHRKYYVNVLPLETLHDGWLEPDDVLDSSYQRIPVSEKMLPQSISGFESHAKEYLQAEPYAVAMDSDGHVVLFSKRPYVVPQVTYARPMHALILHLPPTIEGPPPAILFLTPITMMLDLIVAIGTAASI
jgi:hypothetical protein